jgi:hypothetical protein
MPALAIFTTSGRAAIGVHRHVERGAERLELVDGGGAIHVGGDQPRALALGLEARASLAAVVVLPEPCSPTIMTTVGGTVLSPQPLAPLAEHGRELVVHDLDELLPGRTGLELQTPTACFSTARGTRA